MAKKKPLSNEEEEQRARIWQFVLEHEGFFCDPPPEGLGFPRPGMIPGHYLERPDEWQLDRLRVLNLKRARQVRDEAIGATTASAGMAPETRRLLDSIRRMDAEGLAPERIAAELGVSPAGVRNVLNLGQRAYDASCPSWCRSARAGAETAPGTVGRPMETGTVRRTAHPELALSAQTGRAFAAYVPTERYPC